MNTTTKQRGRPQAFPDQETKSASFTIPAETLRAFNVRAAETGKNKNTLLNEILVKSLNLDQEIA